MCTGDVAVHTYVWTEERPLPFPDFKVERKCRQWSRLEEFAKQAAGNITLPKKPAGGIIEYNHKDF
jgi:hypothetical protein